jgi:threonyl-tRNA synthetase
VIDELLGVFDFVRELYGTVGLEIDRINFSTRPDKYVGTDEEWDRAEAAIETALKKTGENFVVDEGAGTFYGPKIDVDVRDAIGRYWQVATIQVDFQHPQRFNLEYINEDGERVRPVMIHRALYGSVERFVGVLVEHFAGAFPTWLAPVQVAVIPIADRHAGYAEKVAQRLRADRVRVEVDVADDTMGAKIRRHQLLKAPYMLVVGDNEVASGTLSVRRRSGEERRGVPVEEFLADLRAEVDERRVEPSV